MQLFTLETANSSIRELEFISVAVNKHLHIFKLQQKKLDWYL